MRGSANQDEKTVENIRKGIAQAHQNYHCSNAYAMQIFLIAIFVGILARSWGAFALALFIPLFLMFLADLHPVLKWCNVAFCTIYTFGWGAFGLLLGWDLSIIAGIIFGIFGLVIGAGINMGTYQYLQ